jgi:PPOX class probable F420-dependent enzyme
MIELEDAVAEVPESAKDLFRRPNLAWATTVRADGTPHNTVVWVDVDDKGEIVFNTAVGRVKERHLRANPSIALSVLDPENPYHYVTVNGTAEITTEGALDTINRLAKKYINRDTYPNLQPGEVRVNVYVRPERVFYNNPS